MHLTRVDTERNRRDDALGVLLDSEQVVLEQIARALRDQPELLLAQMYEPTRRARSAQKQLAGRVHLA